jgi:RNA polymerase sigma-70 factor (ECF subfamily)
MSEANDRFMGHYQENKDKVFNYLMYRLNFDRALAEDLFMDVVLKAYSHFGEFDPSKASFKTWIFTLAHNHLVNYWRDRQKAEAVSLDQLEEEGVTVAITEMAEDVSAQIDGKNIRKVLSLMADSEREVVTLRYLEDLEYAEISKITGKKEGAIRTSLSRSLNRFSTFYRKLYPPEPRTKPKNLTIDM